MDTKRFRLSIGIISVLFLVMIHLGSNLNIAQGAQYQDIGNYADQSYINYLSGKGIISGYPDGSFKPQEGLTRAQAAVVMVKAGNISIEQAAVSPFKDVTQDYWARPYIAAAAKAGYISGYPDGSFKPEQIITRSQGIVLILKLSQQPLTASLPNLQDINNQHWSAPAVAVGLASGMVGLSTDGQNYYPEAPFSRLNMAHALGILITQDPSLSASSLPGKIKAIQGKTRIKKAGSSSEEELKTVTSVSQGDSIITEKGASAELSYPDGSSLLIKEDTRISIKEAKGRKYIKTNGQEGIAVDWLNLDMKQGTMYTALATKHESSESTTPGTTSTSHKNPTIASLDGREYLAAAAQNSKDMPWYETSKTKKVKVKVDMPWGVAAVRGTVVVFRVDPNGKVSVSCLTGSAEVSNAGQTIPLSQNQSTQLTQEDAPPPQPVPMSPAEVNLFEQVVTWIQETAQSMEENHEQTAPAPPPALIAQLQEILVPVQPTPGQNQTQTQTPPASSELTALQAVNQALGSIGINAGNNGIMFQTNPNSNPGNPSPGGSGGHGGGSSQGGSGIISSVDNISVTISQGTPYILPATVAAKMGDGTINQLPVSWNNTNPDLSHIGVITINGTVTGYTGTVSLILTVKEKPTIQSINDITASVIAGNPYQLPEKVTAKMSDGSTEQNNVVWDVSHLDTSQAGVVTIQGTVAGYSQKINLIITVERRTGQIVPITAGVPLYFAGGIKINLGNMTIPEGATVKVEPVTAPGPSQSGLEVGGAILNIEFQNLDITQAVEISLPLSPGADPSKAGIYYYNNGIWEYQASRLENGVLIATVNHFSIYGVLIDNTPPGNLNIAAGAKTQNSIELIFSARDNAGIKEYEIYRDQQKIASTPATCYIDTNLESGKEYSYQIKARDIFNNQSELSPGLVVKVSSNQKEILSFSLAEQNKEAIINKENHSISMEVKKGTDLTKLSPIITVSEKSTLSPASGQMQDFTNPVSYTVTAQDASQQIWTVTISTAKSNNADMTSLSGVVLSPAFSKDILSYSADVAYYISSVSLSVASWDPEARISINGAAATTGSASTSIPLKEGSNTISISVTAEDGTTQKTYTVNISRNQAPPPPPVVPTTINSIGNFTRGAGWSSQTFLLPKVNNPIKVPLITTPTNAAITLLNADNSVCTVTEAVYGSSRCLIITPKESASGTADLTVTANSGSSSDTATIALKALPFITHAQECDPINVGYGEKIITLNSGGLWSEGEATNLSIKVMAEYPSGAECQTIGPLSNVTNDYLAFTLPAGLPAGTYWLNVIHSTLGIIATNDIAVRPLTPPVSGLAWAPGMAAGTTRQTGSIAANTYYMVGGEGMPALSVGDSKPGDMTQTLGQNTEVSISEPSKHIYVVTVDGNAKVSNWSDVVVPYTQISVRDNTVLFSFAPGAPGKTRVDKDVSNHPDLAYKVAAAGEARPGMGTTMGNSYSPLTNEDIPISSGQHLYIIEVGGEESYLISWHDYAISDDLIGVGLDLPSIDLGNENAIWLNDVPNTLRYKLDATDSDGNGGSAWSTGDSAPKKISSAGGYVVVQNLSGSQTRCLGLIRPALTNALVRTGASTTAGTTSNVFAYNGATATFEFSNLLDQTGTDIMESQTYVYAVEAANSTEFNMAETNHRIYSGTLPIIAEGEIKSAAVTDITEFMSGHLVGVTVHFYGATASDDDIWFLPSASVTIIALATDDIDITGVQGSSNDTIVIASTVTTKGLVAGDIIRIVAGAETLNYTITAADVSTLSAGPLNLTTAAPYITDAMVTKTDGGSDSTPADLDLAIAAAGTNCVVTLIQANSGNISPALTEPSLGVVDWN